jgi:glyoxylase-like metal-dependent hydrolase (beta-lactamase superfamily II)
LVDPEGTEREEGLSWQPLSHVVENPDPLLERILFLQGYEFSSNVYVFVGDDLEIVDPGNDYTAYVELFERGYQPENVRRIVFTHGHPDHAAGVVELLRSYSKLGGTSKPELALHQEGAEQIKEVASEFGCPLTELSGGETLTLGGTDFEVLHTPGETWDAISLHDPASGTIFTGDLVLPDSVAAPDPAAGGDLRHYLGSLRALMARGVKHLLPGHGRPVAFDAARIVEDTYQAVLRRLAGHEVASWMEVAQNLVGLGYVEDTLYACERALKSEPGNLAAQELRALCLNELGRAEEALESLEPVLEATPDNPRALLAKGYALLWMERAEESIAFFDAAISRDPGLKEAELYKGMALYILGRGDEAMEIPVFRDAFSARFAEELSNRPKAGGPKT